MRVDGGTPAHKNPAAAAHLEASAKPLRRRVLVGLLLLAHTLAPLPKAWGEQTSPNDLFPTGELRVGFFTAPQNFNLVVGDPASGEVRGIGGELAQALAAELGAPLVLVPYPSFRDVQNSANDDAWDLTFQATDVAHAVGMETSPAYLLADQTYLVRDNSPIHTVADVDQPGVRIAVSRGNPADMHLSQHLQHAELIRVEADPFSLLTAGEADAVATGRQQLVPFAEQNPDFRVLPDWFAVQELAIAVPSGRSALLAYVSEFVERAKASGLVQQAIERAGVRGVQAAPTVQAEH